VRSPFASLNGTIGPPAKSAASHSGEVSLGILDELLEVHEPPRPDPASGIGKRNTEKVVRASLVDQLEIGLLLKTGNARSSRLTFIPVFCSNSGTYSLKTAEYVCLEYGNR